MSEIPVLEVDEKIAKATNTLAESMSEDINLMHVKPPAEQNDGMDAAGDFLESVHFLEMNNRLLRSNDNESPTCGMEIWYDNNEVKFVFYTPSDSLDQEYRQQMSGYYDGCDIEAITSEEGMFIQTTTERPEAVAVTDLYLDDHYFNPPASPASEENELDNDPFKRIVNEIDTKDDTRVMLQMLYKPAPYDWTELQHTTLETYAKKIQNRGGFKTRWFGFKIDEVDDPGIWEAAASEMRSRINEPAYYLTMRLAVVCTGRDQQQANNRAQSRSRAILNSIEHLYETKAEQRIVPRSYRINEERNAKDTLTKMISREPSNMSQENRIHEIIWEKLTSKTETMVLTADELAGFVHLPSNDEVTSGAIPWTEQMVEGEVPPGGKDVDSVTPEQLEDMDVEDIEDYEIKDQEEEEEDEDEEDKTSDSPSALFDRGD